MVSFDLTYSFTNVALDETIVIILWRIYIDTEIDTTIPKHKMKDLFMHLYKCLYIHLYKKCTF